MDSNTDKLHKFDLFSVLIAILAIVLVGLVAYLLNLTVFHISFINKSTSNGVPIPSSEVLFVTAPVHSLNGKVTSINKNLIIIEQSYSFQFQTPELNQTNSTQPGSSQFQTINRNVTRQINISDKTVITQSPPLIPYLFPTAIQPLGNVQTQSGINSITTGQFINIIVNEDLRLQNPKNLTANSIQLSPTTNIIEGKISSINGNTLTVSGHPLDIFQTQITPTPDSNYSVSISNLTEISKLETPPDPNATSLPIKMSQTDLVVGNMYKFYTDIDVTKASQFTVLRIEPLTTTPSSNPPTFISSTPTP